MLSPPNKSLDSCVVSMSDEVVLALGGADSPILLVKRPPDRFEAPSADPTILSVNLKPCAGAFSMMYTASLFPSAMTPLKFSTIWLAVARSGKTISAETVPSLILGHSGVSLVVKLVSMMVKC